MTKPNEKLQSAYDHMAMVPVVAKLPGPRAKCASIQTLAENNRNAVNELIGMINHMAMAINLLIEKDMEDS